MNVASWPPVDTECVKLSGVKNFLGFEGIAGLLGVTPATVRSYKRFNRLPRPDILIDGKHPGWEPATIHAWHAGRPGPGTRTDLIPEVAPKAPRRAKTEAAARPA